MRTGLTNLPSSSGRQYRLDPVFGDTDKQYSQVVANEGNDSSAATEGVTRQNPNIPRGKGKPQRRPASSLAQPSGSCPDRDTTGPASTQYMSKLPVAALPVRASSATVTPAHSQKVLPSRSEIVDVGVVGAESDAADHTTDQHALAGQGVLMSTASAGAGDSSADERRDDAEDFEEAEVPSITVTAPLACPVTPSVGVHGGAVPGAQGGLDPKALPYVHLPSAGVDWSNSSPAGYTTGGSQPDLYLTGSLAPDSTNLGTMVSAAWQVPYEPYRPHRDSQIHSAATAESKFASEPMSNMEDVSNCQSSDKSKHWK